MTTGLLCRSYELTCISPIHTGSGEKLKPFEYLYNSETHEAAFLNPTKWIAFLDQRGLMDRFSNYVVKGASGIDNLRTWLLAQGITEDELESLIIRRAHADPLDTDGEKATLNEIICQTTLADGRPYIPGSSIKGALRTGILHGLIRLRPQLFHGRLQEFHTLLKNKKKRDIDFLIGQIETQLLHTLKKEQKTPPWNATVSAMRGLRVSDAACPADETDSVILRKLDFTTGMEDGACENRLSLFRESIPAGRRLRFTITVDPAMLRTLGIRSIDEIVGMVHAYTADGLRLQEKVFGRQYPALFAAAKNADALLGGGTGFLSKTLVYALADSDKEARDFIVDYLDQTFTEWDPITRQRVPAHQHRAFDHAISPRTLKLARMDSEDWIMGLCSITEVGNAQTL